MPELASFGVQVCEAALEERQNTNCELHSAAAAAAAAAVRTRRGGTLADSASLLLHVGFSAEEACSRETKHKLYELHSTVHSSATPDGPP
jgi:hypothetical protein